MYYECPECGYKLHNACQPFGWECLGGTDGKPRHHAVKMLEVFPETPPKPNTPEQDDLQAIADIMDKHGWTKVVRDGRTTTSTPWAYLKNPKPQAS